MTRHRALRRLAPPTLTVALAAAIGCASSPDSQATSALVGCWYFERGEVAEELRLPWGVELTDRALTGWPAVQQLDGVREAGTLTPAGVRDFPFAYWRLHAQGDSVHLGHPGGSGFSVDLEVNWNGDTGPLLEGSVRPIGDVTPLGGASGARAVSRVRLTRAGCPA